MSDVTKEKIVDNANKTIKEQTKVNQAKTSLNEIYLSNAPHFISPVNTQVLMLNVVIALLPIVAFSVYLYGLKAFFRILISVVCTVGFESAFRYIIKRDIRAKDFSAVITGILLSLVMPATIPIWILILSTFFAIVIGKEFFGGLGKNPFNPALLGRAFAFVSFAGPMTTWIKTRGSSFLGGLSGTIESLSSLSAISQATPLTRINPIGGIVLSASEIAKSLGLKDANELYLSLFWGNHGGSMGETPIFLILIAFIFLVATKTIQWKITASMIASAFVLSFILGVDPLLTVLSGGLAFGAVFMATDYTTSPVTPLGRIIFGVGCGVLTVVMRIFSSNPEGVMFSILIMNALVPFLNNLLPRKYGYIKGGK